MVIAIKSYLNVIFIIQQYRAKKNSWLPLSGIHAVKEKRNYKVWNVSHIMGFLCRIGWQTLATWKYQKHHDLSPWDKREWLVMKSWFISRYDHIYPQLLWIYLLQFDFLFWYIRKVILKNFFVTFWNVFHADFTEW